MKLKLPKLSTLSSVITKIPKPPLSVLRLGAMTTPMGAGLVGASVVAGVAFANKDKIGDTLGKLGDGVKHVASKAVSSTTEKVAGNPSPPSSTSSFTSTILPIVAVGGLVVAFFIMKKN